MSTKIFILITAAIVSFKCNSHSECANNRFAIDFYKAIRTEDISKIQIASGVKIKFNEFQEDFFTGKTNAGEFVSSQLTFNKFLNRNPSCFIRPWYRWFDWQKTPKKWVKSYSIWFIDQRKVAEFKNLGEKAMMTFMEDFMVCNVVVTNKKAMLDESLCFSGVAMPGGLLGALMP